LRFGVSLARDVPHVLLSPEIVVIRLDIVSVLAHWDLLLLQAELKAERCYDAFYDLVLDRKDVVQGPLVMLSPQVGAGGLLMVSGDTQRIAVSVSIAVVAIVLILLLAIRYGRPISGFVGHQSDEIVLLTMFGTVLIVAGVAKQLQVSPAVGAFLVGITLSGPTADQCHRLLAPLRDLFAATFFSFLGLRSIRPLLPVLWPAAILGIAATKILTGYWSTSRLALNRRGRLRAGTALISRGEFSIVIAGLGVAIEPRLGPLSAAYVLILAVLGPIVMTLAP
jgi:monovalent cation:H+ antiporter-2, CPA2 family